MAEFLDAVQEGVTLLDGGLVLCVLLVGAVGLHDTANLVDLAVQTVRSDEARQLAIEEVHCHTKGRCHACERHTAWT